MHLELRKADITQKPILANLLELYVYDFTEFWDFDIGEDGFYGYEKLPLYWTDPNRFPYLIYVNQKIAGFVLVQQGSPIADNPNLYDIAEFFVLKKYKRQGVGTAAALQIWQQFKGDWQVRVLVDNPIATTFWPKAIQKFTNRPPVKTLMTINNEQWNIYTFTSQG